MIIFEKQPVPAPSGEDEDGPSRPGGMAIVFGEYNFEEQYYATIDLEELGFSPEEGPDIDTEKLFDAVSTVDLDMLVSSENRVVTLKDIFPEFDPQSFTEAPQDVLDGAFLKTHLF